MTIFIGCTIAELSIFRPLIRILFQQIHDLLMVKIPGADEPHQVLLMLDEFYHVGRMDSLISKITISAGYGFRMAIVVQDLAQLDELYGRNTRITTVSGSQIKLFIQINDLETSEFVSEMLGQTTQVYKTPIQRPGQGIFAPRVWTPHYTPRPLRSPLELREMSARLSILMVKNSRSFELTKIRHYLDKPYRTFYEKAKGSPPVFPALRDWQDESLGGAINPAPDQAKEPAEAAPATTEMNSPTPRRTKSRRPPKSASNKATATERPQAPAAPLTLVARRMAKPESKSLSLGIAPPAPPGESCDVRNILKSAEARQDEEFSAMVSVLDTSSGSKTREAADTLASLHRSFGDGTKP
jgi:type IV secretion system protein VirD4